VLVVDDDAPTTAQYARILQLEGYAVRTALDAESALQHVQRARPDAILVDLRMPTMDGLGFVREVGRRVGLGVIPTAMVTGDYTVDDRTTAEIERLGVRLVLKPLWVEELVELMKALLQP
jgi:DNA-binding response OmpR family regulator